LIVWEIGYKPQGLAMHKARMKTPFGHSIEYNS
jgi:hypothetical protein